MKLKSLSNKDRYGNMFSVEFFEPDTTVPIMMVIPDMPDGFNGADTDNHPGDPKGTDTVPAWLTPGENVVNAEASRIPGNQEKIDQMNEEGRMVQKAQGGPIPTYESDGGFIQGLVDTFTLPKPPPGIEYRRHKDGSIGMWAGNTYRGKYKEPEKKESSFSDRLGISYNYGGNKIPPMYAQEGEPVLPLGLRQNNPGNIRLGSDNWLGMIEGGNEGYATFKSPEYGLRSMARTLGTYADQHDIGTVNDLVDRYAPAGDNTEESRDNYKMVAANALGVGINDNIDLKAARNKLMPAMIGFENANQMPYTQQQIDMAIESAGTDDPVAVKAILENKADVPMLSQELIDKGVRPEDLMQPDSEPGFMSARASTTEETNNVGSRPNAGHAKRNWDRKYSETHNPQTGNLLSEDPIPAVPKMDDVPPKPETGPIELDSNTPGLNKDGTVRPKGSGRNALNWDSKYGATHNPDGSLKSNVTIVESTKVKPRPRGKGGAAWDKRHAETHNPNTGERLDGVTQKEVTTETSDETEESNLNSNNPIINNIIAEGEASPQPKDEDTPTVKEIGEKADPSLKQIAIDAIKGAFGDLFSPKEIARLALLYTGSRIMGYSHEGSLSYGVKQYMARLDSREKEEYALVKANAKNYTTESFNKYIQTRDMDDLEAAVEIKERKAGDYLYVPMAGGNVPSIDVDGVPHVRVRDIDGDGVKDLENAVNVGGVKTVDNIHNPTTVTAGFSSDLKNLESTLNKRRGADKKDSKVAALGLNDPSVANEAMSLYFQDLEDFSADPAAAYALKGQMTDAIGEWAEAMADYADGKPIDDPSKSLSAFYFKRRIKDRVNIPASQFGKTTAENMVTIYQEISAPSVGAPAGLTDEQTAKVYQDALRLFTIAKQNKNIDTKGFDFEGTNDVGFNGFAFFLHQLNQGDPRAVKLYEEATKIKNRKE